MKQAPARPPAGSGCDKLAHVYCWLEWLSFGPLLQRCRVQFLPRLAGARHALVLGDGDGRFCAQLLRRVPTVHVTAMDASACMLAALRARAEGEGTASRLETVHGNVMQSLPRGDFDVVCTHFLLDCLSDGEVNDLVAAVRECYRRPVWIVSEFAKPAGFARWPATVVITGLYAAFGLLTGLRVRKLPDHASALRAHGFVLEQGRNYVFGLLRAELWR